MEEREKNPSFFHLEVCLLQGEIVNFTFPARYTVDKVKNEIFAHTPSLKHHAKTDYELAVNDTRLKVEFVKFVQSHSFLKKSYQHKEKLRVSLLPRNVATEVKILHTRRSSGSYEVFNLPFEEIDDNLREKARQRENKSGRKQRLVTTSEAITMITSTPSCPVLSPRLTRVPSPNIPLSSRARNAVTSGSLIAPTSSPIHTPVSTPVSTPVPLRKSSSGNSKSLLRSEKKRDKEKDKEKEDERPLVRMVPESPSIQKHKDGRDHRLSKKDKTDSHSRNSRDKINQKEQQTNQKILTQAGRKLFRNVPARQCYQTEPSRRHKKI